MDDHVSMQRYLVESVCFSENMSSILLRWSDIDGGVGGVVLAEHIEQEIGLLEDDELRQKIWDIVDQLCDVIDQAHADRRTARQTRLERRT